VWRPGSVRIAGGAHSAPPDLLAGFKRGLALWGRDGRSRGQGRGGREVGEGKKGGEERRIGGS